MDINRHTKISIKWYQVGCSRKKQRDADCNKETGIDII